MDFSQSISTSELQSKSAVGTVQFKSSKMYRSYGTQGSEVRRYNNGLKSVVTICVIPTELVLFLLFL